MIPDDSTTKKIVSNKLGVFSCLHLHKFRSENEPIEAISESQIEMLDHIVLFHFCATEKTPCFFAMLHISTSTKFHMKHLGPA